MDNNPQNQGQNSPKSHITLAVIGHVDSGKSTTTAHLLCQLGVVDKKLIDTARAQAADRGDTSLQYAFILDKLESERDRGITINNSYSSFESTSHHFTIIDVPGHRDRLKNMITGASQADVAILIISAVSNEFKAGFSQYGQTRDHALLAFSLGVKQLIICINKMDHLSVKWSEAIFIEIKQEIIPYLKKVGYDTAKIPFIPISGLSGENLIKESTNELMTSWYQGPCLLRVLGNLVAPQRPIGMPLRIPIHNIYKISGYGTVLAGTVRTGVLKPYVTVVFSPSRVCVESKIIQKHGKEIPEAVPGDVVGLHIKGMGVKDFKRGDVCGEAKRDPPKECEEFIAQIVVLDHPTVIKKGYTPIIDCHAAHVACRFEEILTKMTKQGKVIEEKPESLKTGDVGMVKMVPLKPLCVEVYKEYPPLGRFIVRDMKRIVAVGVIKSVVKKMK